MYIGYITYLLSMWLQGSLFEYLVFARSGESSKPHLDLCL